MATMQSLLDALKAKRGKAYYDEFVAFMQQVTDDYNDVADRFIATSSSAVTVGSGTKAFTLSATGKSFAVGSYVLAYKTSDPTVYMIGQVASFSDPTLTISVASPNYGGSGSASAWTIALSAAPINGDARYLNKATGGQVDGATTFTTDVYYGSQGIAHVNFGDPTNGPGGGVYDGGIAAQKISGNGQVCAYQLQPTTGTLPPWGPITEAVFYRRGNSSTNFNRISLTGMADYADPTLLDAAADFRLQQEASGSVSAAPIRFTSQVNDTGALVFHQTMWPDGSVQFFERTDSPSVTGNNLELSLKTSKRGLNNVLTSAGAQDSPGLRLTGAAYDTALHSADWRARVAMTANDGSSKYVLATRKDSASYVDTLSITDAGLLTVPSIMFTGGSDAIGHYEKGTWTPTLKGLTTAGTNTYAVQNGYYVRIENLVHVSARVEISSKDAAMAGSVAVGGLPYAPISSSNSENAFSVSRYYGFGFPASRTQLVAHNDPGGAYIALQAGGNSVANGVIDSSGVSSSAGLIISGSYRIA